MEIATSRENFPEWGSYWQEWHKSFKAARNDTKHIQQPETSQSQFKNVLQKELEKENGFIGKRTDPRHIPIIRGGETTFSRSFFPKHGTTSGESRSFQTKAEPSESNYPYNVGSDINKQLASLLISTMSNNEKYNEDNRAIYKDFYSLDNSIINDYALRNRLALFNGFPSVWYPDQGLLNWGY